MQVIGLLGPSDLAYLVTLIAISRLGHSVLFLSTRISEEAYAGLVKATKATTLLVHSSFQSMGEKVQKATDICVQPVCTREEYTTAGATQLSLLPSRLDAATENENIAWIIHSSGSTGLPKPIYQTHRGAVQNYANNFGLKGFITLPLFHAHGISCLFRAIHSKKLIYMYNADLPLTASHLVSTLQQNDIQILYAVPYALKLLAESEQGIKLLSALELVMFGGSACPKPIGDKLVAQGVRLVSHYGTTETGQLMTSFRDRSDKDWDYVRPTAALMPYLRWEEQSPGIYELCVLEGWPSKVASNRPDNSYATKDLFEKHPTTPDAWRYYARLDDTLVLENGEKANPLLVEGVARENRNVAEAVVFGANKPRLGLFIIPADAAPFTSDEQLIDSIWPVMETTNNVVPAFSRLSRDMIKVLPKGTTYPRTDKGTVIRAAFYKVFDDLIQAAYDEGAIAGTLVLEGTDLTSYLRKELLEIAAFPDTTVLQDDTDLFSLGVDSLQSIRLRSVILKNLDVSGQKISQNFVFENPSLQAMAEELTRLRLGNARKERPTLEQRMIALIEKYSDFAQHIPVERSDDAGEHIVVTGATGSLGAHIAARLASSSTVSKVYCLVRAPSLDSAKTRVRRSMQDRCVYHTLSAASRRKIVSLPSNLGQPQLDLDSETYQTIASDITGMIHCAWSVNFNLALESFEKDCIAGARHLIDLCLKSGRPSPARFAFCSSVSAVAATPGNVAPEDLPPSLLHAQNMGYAQSKLVTEHIVNRAAKQTGMVARVLRVGQIVADTKHGVWNATEAIPMIFQTAETIKALPKLDENPSWTPVDVVADSVIDMSMSPEGGEVMNVVNSRLFHWTDDLLPLLRQAGLDFDELSQQEWVTLLRKSEQDPVINPPIKLVEFFASKYDNTDKRRKLSYDSRKAEKYSPSLRNAGVLDADFVARFVNYFRAQCWRQAEKPSVKQSVIVLSGPCGSGKTTAAHALAMTLGLPLIEGDDLHSEKARQQMGQNIPLTDADRWRWLGHVRGAVMDRLQTTKAPGVVVTCSALRTAYRDELRTLNELGDMDVKFLLLSGDEQELKQRMAVRHELEGHYMKPEMVESQLSLLENPLDRETDIVPIDSARSKEEVLDEVVGVVKDILSV